MSSGAGEFNRYITVQLLPDQNPASGKDEFGEVSGSATTAFECWAAYEPVGTREFPLTLKRFAETTARFRIRYRTPQPDPATHQILFDGRTWDIHGVMEVEYHRELHIEVSEVK